VRERDALWPLVDKAKLGQEAHEAAVLELAHQFVLDRVLGTVRAK